MASWPVVSVAVVLREGIVTTELASSSVEDS